MSHVGYNGMIDGIPRHTIPVGDVEFAERIALLTKKPAIILGGHTHTVLNLNGLNTIYKSIPILQAGSHGSHLGEAQLTLFQTQNGLRSQAQAKLFPLKKRDKRVALTDPTAKNFEQDTDIDLEFEKTVMSPLYNLLGTRLKEVIGQAGNVAELAQEKVIAERYVGQCTMANFMNDAIVSRSKDFPVRPDGAQLVDIAVFNASGVNGGITPNTAIAFNDWYNVMPFADMIVVANMTGAQIKQMVMSNAQRIVRPEQLKENGGNVTSDDLKGYGVSYGFLHFSRGLTYTLKLGNSASEATANDIRIQGVPIDSVLSKTFSVAFGDYTAVRGGEGWKGETNVDGHPSIGFNLTALPQNDTGLVYRNEIIRYIKENGMVDTGSGAMKDERLKVIR
jgi:2',3'-cyclic-nucleotide 2'-phosphodiesterase (5'-nucleotidase family)